jgi:CheY-like chemotaxis protein
MEALYIEDNPIEQRLMQLYLTDMSIKLHLAGSGFDGLGIAQKVLPSFIITDLNLPDIEGDTLIKLLKQYPQLKETPVIITTADLLAKEKYDISGIGVTAYLIKPVSKAKLAAILRKLL